MLELQVDRSRASHEVLRALPVLSSIDCTSLYPEDRVVLKVSDKVSLIVHKAGAKRAERPFFLDLLSGKLQWRLQHPGSEALCKACLRGLEEPALVYDATAGMGRDSMLLSSRGADVVMFERHPVIYLLLLDACMRARAVLPSVPALFFGEADVLMTAEHTELSRPQVIYYDPMFPHRRKTALVKKDMQLFQQTVGQDEDTLHKAESLFALCTKRLVIKRPQNEPPLASDILKVSYQVSGGACRFDCYVPPVSAS